MRRKRPKSNENIPREEIPITLHKFPLRLEMSFRSSKSNCQIVWAKQVTWGHNYFWRLHWGPQWLRLLLVADGLRWWEFGEFWNLDYRFEILITDFWLKKSKDFTCKIRVTTKFKMHFWVQWQIRDYPKPWYFEKVNSF